MQLFFQGIENATTWTNLVYCLIGVTIGMLVGVMPGIGPVSGTAALIPLTFGMDPLSAIIMLAGIYYGAMYGGTITSVLINIPGESASVITCIDGYQMTLQGRGGTALGVAAIGSFIGGVVAIAGLATLAPALAKFALRFGPVEYFTILLMGLMMLMGLMGRSIVRGLAAALIGLLLSLVGMDFVSGESRFTLGLLQLERGIDFVPMALGLFGISELLLSLEEKINAAKPAQLNRLLPERHEWKPTMKAIGRGTGIGFLIGLIPGANAVIASLISYTVEKKTAKDPSRFGKGAIEGVAAPETANNACSGSAMIPLFTLGIPSSPTIAILFGAFVMHGLTPGPTLFQRNPDFVWAIIASMLIGNIMLLILNLPLARLWARVAMIPYQLLFPFIMVISIIGAYSLNNSLWDVGVMLVFGVVGYAMKKLDFPLAAMILTFVLGRSIESSLLQSLILSDGSLAIFFSSPLSSTFMTISILILVFSVVGGLRKKKIALSDSEI